MKLIGSITTLPKRLLTIIDPVKYILRQSKPLDILYINIPLKTLKGELYDIPKDFLSHFNGFQTKVVLNRCEIDYGPITKLAPVLDIEKNPDTCIFTFDDDIIVHRDVVKKLYDKSFKYPNSCLGFSGICVGNFPFYFQYVINNTEDCPVDWIQGVHVVMYKRSFFSTIEDLVSFGNDTHIKDILVFNDDHRISSYLSTKNIQRISIGYNIKDYLFNYSNKNIDALCHRHIELHKEHYKIISYFSSKNIYNHTYNVKMSLTYIFLTGILNGCLTFYFSYNINKNIFFRLSLFIITVIIYYKLIGSKYGLKTFKRRLLLKNK